MLWQMLSCNSFAVRLSRKCATEILSHCHLHSASETSLFMFHRIPSSLVHVLPLWLSVRVQENSCGLQYIHRSTFVKRLTPMRWDLWRDEAQRTCDMIGTQSIRVVKKYEVEVEQGGGCSRRRRPEEEVRYTLPPCTPTPWMMSGGSIFSRILIFKDHRHTNKEQVSLLEG